MFLLFAVKRKKYKYNTSNNMMKVRKSECFNAKQRGWKVRRVKASQAKRHIAQTTSKLVGQVNCSA